MRKRFSPEKYIEGILEGDRVILSQAITLVESELESDLSLAEGVMQGILPYTGNALRIGISGVPGSGKSTFIEALGQLVLENNKHLAVLTIDPSSAKTGGSILGDKTRMNALANDPNVYIRPSPSGKTLGGVSAKTREILMLCEAAGFDLVMVETVGVGQSEVKVKEMVDVFLLLLITGAGDELQGIKKGIMEMADLLLINKADGENKKLADRTRKDLEKVLHYFSMSESGWSPKVLTCSAISGDGIPEVWKALFDYQTITQENGFFDQNRTRQKVNWMTSHISFLLERRFFGNKKAHRAWEEGKQQVVNGEASPISKARELVEVFFSKSGF